MVCRNVRNAGENMDKMSLMSEGAGRMDREDRKSLCLRGKTGGSAAKRCRKTVGIVKVDGKPGKNSGFVSVEAAFVGAILIIITMFSVYAMVYILNTASLRDYMYQKVYSVPLVQKDSYIKYYSDKDNLAGVIMWCDDYKMAGSCSNGIVSMAGMLDMKGITRMICRTENGLCTDRLRRWQLYDDIAEDALGE